MKRTGRTLLLTLVVAIVVALISSHWRLAPETRMRDIFHSHEVELATLKNLYVNDLRAARGARLVVDPRNLRMMKIDGLNQEQIEQYVSLCRNTSVLSLHGGSEGVFMIVDAAGFAGKTRGTGIFWTTNSSPASHADFEFSRITNNWYVFRTD